VPVEEKGTGFSSRQTRARTPGKSERGQITPRGIVKGNEQANRSTRRRTQPNKQHPEKNIMTRGKEATKNRGQPRGELGWERRQTTRSRTPRQSACQHRKKKKKHLRKQSSNDGKAKLKNATKKKRLNSDKGRAADASR